MDLNLIDYGESFCMKAPKTKEHLAVFIATAFNIRLPAPAVCLEHQAILDALWNVYAELDYVSIWYAMRGSGKTFVLSMLGWLETVFKPGCLTTILGGSLEQSTKAVMYMDNLWAEPCLEELKNKVLKDRQVTGRGFKTNYGSKITALAASSRSVRGPHPQKLRLDEVDEMAEPIYNASLGQPKSSNGILDHILISSTLHHPFGLMSKILDEADEKGAQVYKWCVNEIVKPFGFWEADELERRKLSMPVEMWESEYLLMRPKAGKSIFNFEQVIQAGKRGKEIEGFIKHVKIEASIDWGFNCSVMHLIQDLKDSINVVESYEWNNTELNHKLDEITDILIEKNVAVVFCDSNPKDSWNTLLSILKKKRFKVSVIPVAFNAWKMIGIDVIRFMLAKNLINFKNDKLVDFCKKYHYKDEVKEIIDKIDDHYPDALIAWASSRWRILRYLSKQRQKEIENKELKLLKSRIY